MARTRKKPVPAPAGEGVEVIDAPVQVIARAAAIDVAKGSGMVCTRLPSETRAGRRTQRVQEVTATFAAVVALMDHLVNQGIERLVLESTSDYWRIWYYLAEAAGLEVWLVNARDVKHLPGRSKSDKLDCVWLCKLNEWGMLRRSFVPPEQIRDLRALTRLRTHLVHDRTRHQNRIEKILEDALLKISSLISDLMGASGRRMLAALVNGERSPKALAALGDYRLRATPAQLEAALTGRFRDIHAFEIGMLLELTDDLTAKITRLDQQITGLLEQIPGISGACTSCGVIGGGGHAPGCASDQAKVLSVIERLDEITGVGIPTAQVIIAELGTDMTQFPTPGHAAAWARLTSRTIQSGTTAKNGRTGKGNPYLRGAFGAAVMTAANTDTFLGERYRRIARRRGKQKAIVAVARTICEIAYLIINDPGFRYIELGAGYYARLDPKRQTSNKIRELEKLNPGMVVTLTPREPDPGTPATQAPAA
jgi:transposase